MSSSFLSIVRKDSPKSWPTKGNSAIVPEKKASALAEPSETSWYSPYVTDSDSHPERISSPVFGTRRASDDKSNELAGTQESQKTIPIPRAMKSQEGSPAQDSFQGALVSGLDGHEDAENYPRNLSSPANHGPREPVARKEPIRTTKYSLNTAPAFGGPQTRSRAVRQSTLAEKSQNEGEHQKPIMPPPKVTYGASRKGKANARLKRKVKAAGQADEGEEQGELEPSMALEEHHTPASASQLKNRHSDESGASAIIGKSTFDQADNTDHTNVAAYQSESEFDPSDFCDKRHASTATTSQTHNTRPAGGTRARSNTGRRRARRDTASPTEEPVLQDSPLRTVPEVRLSNAELDTQTQARKQSRSPETIEGAQKRPKLTSNIEQIFQAAMRGYEHTTKQLARNIFEDQKTQRLHVKEALQKELSRLQSGLLDTLRDHDGGNLQTGLIRSDS